MAHDVVVFPVEGSLDRFLIEARRLLGTAYATDDEERRVAITIAQLRMVADALSKGSPLALTNEAALVKAVREWAIGANPWGNSDNSQAFRGYNQAHREIAAILEAGRE